MIAPRSLPRAVAAAAMAALLAAPAWAVPLRMEFEGVLVAGDPYSFNSMAEIGAPGRLVIDYDAAAVDSDPGEDSGRFRDPSLSAVLMFDRGFVTPERVGNISTAAVEIGEGDGALRYGALTAFLPFGSEGRTREPLAGIYVQMAGRSLFDADRLPGTGVLETLLTEGGGMFALQLLFDRDADLVFEMTAARVVELPAAEVGVSPVRLPASGWALVLGLGAVAAIRRLRR